MRTGTNALLLAVLLLACSPPPDIEEAEPGVFVVDAGSLPGRVVRYRYPDGDWPRFHIGVEVKATWSAGDHLNQPAPLPRGRFPVSIRTKPRADGSADATVRIGRPVPAIDGCHEFEGEMTLDPTGRIESTSLAVPPDAPAALRPVLTALLARISRLLLPLPRENMGVGARWRVVRELDEGSIDGAVPTVEILTCRLVRLSADNARITMALYRGSKGLPRQFPLSDGHGEVTAEHRAGTATGRGTLTIDLRHFYLGGEETVTATRVYDVGDARERHQVVKVVETARTFIAD